MAKVMNHVEKAMNDSGEKRRIPITNRFICTIKVAARPHCIFAFVALTPPQYKAQGHQP